MDAAHAGERGRSTQRAPKRQWLELAERDGAGRVDGGVGSGEGGRVGAARERSELGGQRGTPGSQHAQQEVLREALQRLRAQSYDRTGAWQCADVLVH